MTRRARQRGPAVGATALLTLCVGGVSATPARAAGALELEGAYTIIAQTSDDRALADSTTGSLDFYLTWSRGAGRIFAYIEGNSSLKDDGVATRLPRSNGDAGTALDVDRSGRFQVSELKYRHAWPGNGSISAGLLDPSAYLDATRISNDENLQFLGASFVNNPTIEFPDYTLGTAAQLVSGDERRRWNVVLASSNGIADNPNLSYSQLLNVTDANKGAFVGVETAWPSRSRVARVGAWWNGADHETLDTSRDDASNYGAYAAWGASRGAWATNLRLGAANADVSLAKAYASVGLQHDRDRYVVGLATAYTWISSAVGRNDPNGSLHAETYVRFRLAPDLYLTPAVQYLVHGGFDSAGSPLDKTVVVYSLRVHHVFLKP